MERSHKFTRRRAGWFGTCVAAAAVASQSPSPSVELVTGAHAATETIILAATDEHHHRADACTLATTILKEDTAATPAISKMTLLMGGGPTDKPAGPLINWEGNDVSTNCEPTGDVSIQSVEDAFAGVSAGSDVVFVMLGFGGYQTFLLGGRPDQQIAETTGGNQLWPLHDGRKGRSEILHRMVSSSSLAWRLVAACLEEASIVKNQCESSHLQTRTPINSSSGTTSWKPRRNSSPSRFSPILRNPRRSSNTTCRATWWLSQPI